MNVSKNKVVSIDYTLKNDAGETLDTSNGREPLSYIHGLGYIVPGLENALEGKKSGDSLKVSVKPEDGYGLYNKDLNFDLEKDKFNEIENLTVGMQVQMQTEHGPVVLTVKSIEDDKVTLDANHPLAGETLHFDVAIKEIREATEEEIEHGHIHD